MYMNVYMRNIIFVVLFFFTSNCQSKDDASRKLYDNLVSAQHWTLVMDDECTDNWQDQWFLDGTRAIITHSDKGMNFAAGSELMNDTCHAVLWTKDSFEGDLKVEYDFTRTDKAVKCVNIIYLQVVGVGKGAYTKDISQWNQLREVPHMRTYFRNMDALHLSYAAFAMQNEDANSDYIRARRYPVKEGDQFSASTEVEPTFFDTGLFKTNVKYHIIYVKTTDDLFMRVVGGGCDELYHWGLTSYPELQKGRIGLRHMFTRASTYKNFKVYQF